MPSTIELVLASASPRRQELFTLLNYPFDVYRPKGSEHFDSKLSLTQAVEAIACQKLEEALSYHPKAMVVACDTLVVCDQEILGKPKDEKDAKRILITLSNRTHQVISSVAISYKGKKHQFSEVCQVSFYELSSEMIESYIATKEPFDKAGAYGIQGKAALFVKRIEGDYNSIVGFPMHRFLQEVKKIYHVDLSIYTKNICF